MKYYVQSGNLQDTVDASNAIDAFQKALYRAGRINLSKTVTINERGYINDDDKIHKDTKIYPVVELIALLNHNKDFEDDDDDDDEDFDDD